MSQLILVINTGNTSTKVAIFEMEKKVYDDTIRHTDAELSQFADINAQKDFREKLVLEFLEAKSVPVTALKAVSARGGLLRPMESGACLVNETMIADLIEAKRGLHASHLSARIGYSIAQKSGIPCYVVDPVSVDEFNPLARFTGHKKFERIMLSHALNMKAVAKRYARENRQDYNQLTLLVVHLGTGVSVSIHENGRMTDAINSSEEGCFSLDRSGGLPILQIARYIIEENISYKDFSKMVFGKGGMYSYLGVTDFRVISERYKAGDEEAISAVQAMAYQIAKETGALAATVGGKVDQILITGGMAYQEYFVKLIADRIRFIAPIRLYPGEDEMEALAEGVCRVLNGEEHAHTY